MGQTLPSLSKLSTILQDIHALYLARDAVPLMERVPLAFAESKYQRLLSWADTLPTELTLRDHSPAHVYFLQ